MTATQILASKTIISRYSKEETARDVANRRRESVILGDDNKYWVMSRASAECLFALVILTFKV